MSSSPNRRKTVLGVPVANVSPIDKKQATATSSVPIPSPSGVVNVQQVGAGSDKKSAQASGAGNAPTVTVVGDKKPAQQGQTSGTSGQVIPNSPEIEKKLPSPSPYPTPGRDVITPIGSTVRIPAPPPPPPPPFTGTAKIAALAFNLPVKKKPDKVTQSTNLPAGHRQRFKDRELVNQMQAFLTENEILRLGQRFKKLDADSSGSISLAEFRSIPELQNNPLIDRIVEVFDVDKNGEVDFREFIRGMSQFTYSDNSESRQRFAFRIFDINNDGFISSGELFQVLQAMCGTNLTDIQLQQLIDHTFMMCDNDRDGKISFKEFCSATKNSDAHKRMMIDKVFL